MKAVDIVTLPLVLLWQSVRIYALPTLGAYVPTLRLFKARRFQDVDFPASAASLGGTAAQAAAWRRLDEIFAKAGSHNIALFYDDPVPADIMQGQVGNCWLMSAFACLASVPGAVQACFVTKRYNARGKYTMRMYDQAARAWRRVTVSDCFPCDTKGQPLFAKPNGEEGWVLIAEKAFAKFMGSYANLDGGNTTFGLKVLTGDPVCSWKLDAAKGSWQRMELVHMPAAPGAAARAVFGMRRQNHFLSGDEMFRYLRALNKKRSLLAASAGQGGNDSQARDGIVQGHAYAVLRLKAVQGFRLVQFRNPWGSFEWKGDWCDASALWTQHPRVQAALRHTVADDGAFWMEWRDVQRHFHNFDVCMRTRGFRDLVLDYNEERGRWGPAIGCCTGCFAFWFRCRGCFAALAHDADIRDASLSADTGGGSTRRVVPVAK